ncbi:MAG: glutamine-hydrolyzing GMP synthase, partial [bacterium]
MKTRPEDHILILDFGAQYTQLISRKVRELGVYSEIKPFTISSREIQNLRPKGLILSGGPESVYEKDAPLADKNIFGLGIPILGICYGLQVVAHFYGGQVGGSQKREYGLAELKIDNPGALFKGLKPTTQVWMSHGDALNDLPPGFAPL